ncbi:MAG: alpha/beta hydrolase [Candidatus Omnitrophota bacterium]
MRTIYIVVSALFLITVFLFIGAFVYLDKEKRSTYYYVVNVDGHDVGSIKIERFVTEDKLIYRSVREMPFEPFYKNSKTRLVLDKRYVLNSYLGERSGNGGAEIFYIERKEGNTSSVSVFQSEFAYAKNIPVKEGAFIFKEDSPVTYLPLIENYNFKKGRFQGFNALTPFAQALPPIRRFITLTSIRDEYLKIGSRSIKTECLFLKIRNYPQGSIWVSKSDRSLVMLELPARHLRITRTFSPPVLPQPENYTLQSDRYTSREAVIKNGGIQLSGTMTVPSGEGTFPAVLLLCGPGPQDRDYQGLFLSLADHLSRNGFCVLRFDKRGIASSGGDFSATTDSDELSDGRAALDYMETQKEADPGKIAIVAHSKGVWHAMGLSKENPKVKAMVMMAPLCYTSADTEPYLTRLRGMSVISKWSDEYLKSAMKSNLETWEVVTNTKRAWASVLGKRCFTKRMKEWLETKPLETAKGVSVPVLILQGREDEEIFLESATALDKALEEGGNKYRSLTYFGYLGHFFGPLVNDGVRTIHYETDTGVMEQMARWLKDNLADKPVELTPVEAVPQESPAPEIAQ